MMQQAEDVMRSLLEEYRTAPEKQDNDAIEGSDKAIVTDEEKIIVTDEEKAIIKEDDKPNPEESSSHEPENGKTACEGLENSKQELQKSSTSENRKSPVQCFKNVVAIVDPPRSGLHPTVSNIFSISFDISHNFFNPGCLWLTFIYVPCGFGNVNCFPLGFITFFLLV